MNNQHTHPGHCIYFLPHVFGGLLAVWFAVILIEPGKALNYNPLGLLVILAVVVVCMVALAVSFRDAFPTPSFRRRGFYYSTPLAFVASCMLLIFFVLEPISNLGQSTINNGSLQKQQAVPGQGTLTRLKLWGLETRDINAFRDMKNHQEVTNPSNAMHKNEFRIKGLPTKLVYLLLLVGGWIITFEICRKVLHKE